MSSPSPGYLEGGLHIQACCRSPPQRLASAWVPKCMVESLNGGLNLFDEAYDPSTAEQCANACKCYFIFPCLTLHPARKKHAAPVNLQALTNPL